jgi:hypothetical protein
VLTRGLTQYQMPPHGMRPGVMLHQNLDVALASEDVANDEMDVGFVMKRVLSHG